jgi:hypothetical protein
LLEHLGYFQKAESSDAIADTEQVIMIHLGRRIEEYMRGDNRTEKVDSYATRTVKYKRKATNQPSGTAKV